MTILLCLLAWAQEKTPEPPVVPESVAASEEGIFGIPVHGTLSMKYRARWNVGDSDHDLYEYLSADFGKPLGTVTGHLFLRATEDVGGFGNTRGYYPFDGITDTYGSLFNARFYYGYVDVNRVGPTELIRVGRQFLHETPVRFYVDGLRVESKPLEKAWGLHGGLYGGLPVHLFEGTPRGDFILGAYAEATIPWTGARARLDYTHIQDDTILGNERDDLIGFGLRQAIGEKLFLQGQYNWLNGKSRDLLLRANFYEPAWDLRLDASFYELIEPQRELSIDLDYFFTALFEYKQYGQGRLVAAKGVGEHLVLQAGAEVRELLFDDDGPLNREFRHFWLTPVVSNWLLPGLSFSVTGEIWEVPGTDNGDVYSAGFDVTHRCSEKIKVSAGTSYALYKYDYFSAIEREHVRTVYGKVSYAPRKDLKFDVAYEFERSGIDDFHVLKFGAGYSF